MKTIYVTLAFIFAAIFSGVVAQENSIESEIYDITGKITGKSKSYFDDLGKPLQSQTLDIKTNKVWATQTLYDAQGRPAISTLGAPIGSGFGFTPNFIKNTSGNTFSTSDFGSLTVDASPVSNQENTLGWYYSDANTNEPYQDITDRPYSRTIYSELNPGTVLKVIGGNKMEGQWKQGYSFSMPAGQELTQPDAFGDPKYAVYNDERTEALYKIIKTVARDIHGVEAVVFTDTDGRTLAAARSGSEEGGITNDRTSFVKIGEQGFVDIHIPVGRTGITLAGTNGSNLDIYDLITEELVTTEIGELPNGFYRITVKDPDSYIAGTITVTYPENYYDYSLNYYNEIGRLISTKQPLNKLESTFEYNILGQLTQTHSPDEGDAWFLYREDGQIRFSVNTKQWENREFSYTNYDQRGRPVESGVYSDNVSNYLNTFTATITKDTDPFKSALKNIIDTPDGDGLADTRCSEVHKTTYDRISDTERMTLPSAYRNPSFLAGNVARTWNNQTTTYYSYDIYGRVKWIIQVIPDFGIKTIDYEYDPITSQVNRVIYQKGQPDLFIHKYTYDPDDYSLTKVETATNINGPYTPHAAYEYYETGGLKSMTIGDNLQKMDYVYNLNGALKSINHPSLSSTKDPGNPVNGVPEDIFGMTVHYYKDDYHRTSRTNIATTPNGIDQYNGNIKAITWNTREEDTQAGSADTYYYDYNKNNWLTGASYNQNINDGDPNLPATITRNSYVQPEERARKAVVLEDGFSFKASTTTPSFTGSIDDGTPVAVNGAYNVSGITYDANGNIQKLTRNRDLDGGSTAMDQLEYEYDTEKPNQLKQVIDQARADTNADDIKTQDTDNYVYNKIGQLIENKTENIKYLYNASGLVTEVLHNNQPAVRFFYNDKNHRIKKESLINNYTEYYIRDAAGTPLAIYRNGSIQEYTIYGSGRVGIYKPGGATLYQLTDHLGNVRAVVSDQQPRSGNVLRPSGKTDYYPFGMPMPNRNLKGDYRYAYQGQEKDTETGKEAFELRLWDSRIGRWLTTDPKREFSSPYLGMGNNPISLIDPDGGSTGLHDMKLRKFKQESVKITGAWVSMMLLDVSFKLNSAFEPFSENMETFAESLPPVWIITAATQKGVKEKTGNNDGLAVEKFLKSAGLGKGHAWCASFVNYCFEHNGINGVEPRGDIHPANALSWRKWKGGSKLANPAFGAIATKKRKGGGHVGFVVGKNSDGKIVVLGGNQSDTVKFNVYSSSILQFHYPRGQTPNFELPLYDLDGSGIIKEN